MSLLVHPDRVDENRKLEATEKFKVLGKIHSVLQDPEKRKIYDETGDVDEENDSTFNWMDYWRAMFKEITTEDIEKYEKDYINSETELRDIKKAYIAGKGDWDHIFEMVPFSNCESESRIVGIVKKLVEDEEVEKYDAFFKEPQKKKEKRRRKFENEKRMAESLKSTYFTSFYFKFLSFYFLVDDKDLQMKIQRNHEKREKSFANLIAGLEEKYSKKETKRKSLKNGPSVSPLKST